MIEILIKHSLIEDIVGIVIKLNQLHPVHTSTGKDQLQVKLKMTDGRSLPVYRLFFRFKN